MNTIEEAIFHAASELEDTRARAAFLERACGTDPALRARIEALLQADLQARKFLAKDPLGLASELGHSANLTSALPEEAPGNVIGRYKLLQRIGEGGMGVVYMAEQQEPVRRRVALKIIKLGMDTKQVVARFEAERQALALMDHPNIARVLDGGATETGRPYFVMELVQGVQITEFCDKNQLSAQERLKLFIPVCQAVQSAHQKGIIHRDLKPTNILVTLNPDGSGFPKVIDFGVAKATSQKLTEKTLFTAHGMMVGTPAYMSPEQAEMSHLDVDTRADIYSLGALLYELLTGSTPFPEKRLRSAGYNEMQRIILEEQPERPSTRLSTLQGEQRSVVAQNRGASELTLGRAFPGDLDWIVMKCLEKDRARRYETANGLGRDLERHLQNEPVMARPPSRLYEFQKTVRRHRVGFAAVGAVVAALSLGLVVSGLEAARARRAERLARQAKADESNQKTAAQELFYKSLVGEAHAMRLARRVGYRDQVFSLLEEAKALEVPTMNLRDLRQEAVACLGDFVGLGTVTIDDFPTNLDGGKIGTALRGARLACLDASGNYAAFGLIDGTIQLREMPSGKAAARFPCTNGVFWDICFNTIGSELFALAGPMPGGRRFREIMPHRRLYAWARDGTGHWMETQNNPLPGADLLLNTGPAPGVFAVIHEVASVKSGDGESDYLRFKLFSLTTRDFVPGYDVTHSLCPHCGVYYQVGGNGRWLAMGTGDNVAAPVVNLYDWKACELIHELPKTMGRFSRLAGDGRYIACDSVGGVGIYTVPALERVGRFEDNSCAPVFSGSTLALVHGGVHRIHLWNLATREDIAMLDDPDAAVPVAFSLDRNALLSVGSQQAHLYRLNTPEKLDLPAHGGAVTAVDFGLDGARLASVGKDGVLRVCDVVTGQILWQTNSPGHCVSYSRDGQWLATSGWETEFASIWDAHNGQRLLALGTNVVGRTSSVQFSPDGRYLATAGADGIKILSIEHTKPTVADRSLEAALIQSWGCCGDNVVFAPNSQFLLFEGLHTKEDLSLSLCVWDFKRSAQPRCLASLRAGTAPDYCFTEDGNVLTVHANNLEAVTWDVTTGKAISSLQLQEPQLERGISGHPRLCLSPEGSKLAVSSASGTGVDIWSPKVGKLLYSLPVDKGTITWLAWSPNSRSLAVCRDNGNIAIWDLGVVAQILAKLGLSP